MFDLLLPSSDITIWWPGIIVLGAFIGFLTGMYGVGGGFLLTPFLKIIFGLPYPLAVGCSLILIFLNSLLSVWGHWKKKSVDPQLGLIMAVGALIGTEVGIRILQFLDRGGFVVLKGNNIRVIDLVLNCTFIILMLIVCIAMLLETSRKQQKSETRTRLFHWQQKISLPPVLQFKYSTIEQMSLWVPFICSLGIGVFTGLLGVGGGFIYLPLLIYVIGTPTLVAVGTSPFVIIFASAYGSVRYFYEGNISLIILGLLFIGSFAGVKLGVYSAYFFGGRKIRRSFVLVIAVGIAVILWDIVRGILL